MKYGLLLLFTSCALWGDGAFAQAVTLADLPNTLPGDIVIIGEVHDNHTHHQTQADLVARWKPAALVFEMLTPDQAAKAEGADRKNAAEMAKALAWEGTGWPDYAMYHPIFAVSGAARLYGAALDRAEVRRAMTQGAALVFGADAARYGLGVPLPKPEQTAREADQLAAHCNALPAEMLPQMVEAQRLRDAAFARSTLQALQDTGGPVVVITGSGHADIQRGIPAALAAASDAKVYSIGQVESDPGPDAPFDAWIITAPTPREDPCAAFTKP